MKFSTMFPELNPAQIKALQTLIEQEVIEARISELKEIQMADNLDDGFKDLFYQAYVKDRIAQLKTLTSEETDNV